MCYTGMCIYEEFDGTCGSKESHCPDITEACECGCELKQLQEDGKYHCLDCDKIID